MTGWNVMAETKLKVAVVGIGKMGAHHVRAIGQQEAAKLIAVCDQFGEKANESPFLPTEVVFFRDPEKMLEAIRPDVVHICTPAETHGPLARLAIDHGSHVYVEKPFTLETSEAKSLIKLAEQKKVSICAGHQYLFEDPCVRSRELLHLIGDVVHVESYFSFRQVRRNISRVDQLIDIFPHPVYLLLHFLDWHKNDEHPISVRLDSLDVRTTGEVLATFRSGNTSGVLITTLRGRPVEHYLRIVGTNGSLHADFVRGMVTKLIGPGASAPAAILNPYLQASQIAWGSTRGFMKRLSHRQRSYPGLVHLIGQFYQNILAGAKSPLTSDSILETVRICEVIGERLKSEEQKSETQARLRLEAIEEKTPSPMLQKAVVLVTGGTGFLGRSVVSELRKKGWPVRVVARRLPSYSDRVALADYHACDLGDSIPESLLVGVENIVHCAAGTEGGKDAHERGTILATRNIITAAAKANIRKVVHISSLAVLKPSRVFYGRLVENSPVEQDNLRRGPYVWAKAESEHLARELGNKLGVSVKIIRPGPLVDFQKFEAPGRLGREVGPLFVAVGGSKTSLSICDVHTAAEVIRAYFENFDEAPSTLNLVEPDAPTRAQLIRRLREVRPDLRVMWLPAFILKGISPLLKLAQIMLLKQKNPIDIYVAFASERYDTTLARAYITKIRQSTT